MLKSEEMSLKIKFKLDKLNKEIIRSGLSINELAERSGLNRYTISKILNREIYVHRTTVAKISKALDIDACEISEMIID